MTQFHERIERRRTFQPGVMLGSSHYTFSNENVYDCKTTGPTFLYSSVTTPLKLDLPSLPEMFKLQEIRNRTYISRKLTFRVAKGLQEVPATVFG